jgi:archaemetzincin
MRPISVAQATLALLATAATIGLGCGEAAGSDPVTIVAPPPVVPSPTPIKFVPSRVATAEPEPATRSAVAGVDCVEIQPIGKVTEARMQTVSSAIRDTYRVEVRVLDPMRFPRDAYYPKKKRYRAEILLRHLVPRLSDDCDRIVGLTQQDISTTKAPYDDWGILGLADMPGTAAVVSSFRTRRKIERVSASERLARVAIHELGHTLGLPHCPTRGCMLSDAGGTVVTIDTETELCDVCLGRLAWRGARPPSRKPKPR